MKSFRGFAIAAAALAFLIAVLGSWVRINGAGLTCPDWPLCHGALVPTLRGGVILEWSHRLVAFMESFVVLGAIVSGWRVRREIAGVTPALGAIAVVFLLQVALGGATVFLANSPLSVAAHWGTGMALLAALVVLAVLAVRRPAPVAAMRGGAATGPLILAAGAAFATMCVGAVVSSSYAGLACTTIPACDGSLFGQTPAQLVQMAHRLLAAVCAAAALYAGVVARRATGAARGFAYAGVALVVVQVGLGIGNVLWKLPIGLREAHAANAAATFVAFTLAASFSALEPRAIPERTAERSVTAHRIASRA